MPPARAHPAPPAGSTARPLPAAHNASEVRQGRMRPRQCRPPRPAGSTARPRPAHPDRPASSPSCESYEVTGVCRLAVELLCLGHLTPLSERVSQAERRRTVPAERRLAVELLSPFDLTPAGEQVRQAERRLNMTGSDGPPVEPLGLRQLTPACELDR